MEMAFKIKRVKLYVSEERRISKTKSSWMKSMSKAKGTDMALTKNLQT